MAKAVCLLSGGMDSAVCASIAKNENFELAFLHLNYKQRTEEKELFCFNKLVEHFGVKEKLVVDVNYFNQIGGSSLTDETIEVRKAELNLKDIPTSYVPFRNANILSIAVAWAEVIGAEKIFIGASEEDYSGYPDCRKIFYDKFNELIAVGTKPSTKLEIVTPLMFKNKSEIVKIGMELKTPFEFTWSCYKNNDKACGECDSCALRLRGFRRAGFEDPIEYYKRPIYD